MWIPATVRALDSVPGYPVINPEWSIQITPEGYSDIALDERPGFQGREYLSGEWGSAICYSDGTTAFGPTWFREVWGYPCWKTNSNFMVVQEVQPAIPSINEDGFERSDSIITDGRIEVTITNEMLDLGPEGGLAQGLTPAGEDGAGVYSTSSRYVFRQTYLVKNISDGPLTEIKFFKFLHGLESATCVYDDRHYPGSLSNYRYDLTQLGTSYSFNNLTGGIFRHDDTLTLHARRPPDSWECGYYGRLGVDDHRNGKPSVGVHWSVESNSLDGTDSFDPPEDRWVSGAMRFDLPDLESGASEELTALFSLRTVSIIENQEVEIRIFDIGFDNDDLFIDFKEEQGIPVNGFLLHHADRPDAVFPDEWTPVSANHAPGTPYPGAHRFTVPADQLTDPGGFYMVEAIVFDDED